MYSLNDFLQFIDGKMIFCNLKVDIDIGKSISLG